VLEGMIGQPYVVHTILESKNVGKVYNRDQMLKMGDALLNSNDHYCWSFYQKEEVEQLYQLYEQQPG
jgi:tRNA A22 N-methylase